MKKIIYGLGIVVILLFMYYGVLPRIKNNEHTTQQEHIKTATFYSYTHNVFPLQVVFNNASGTAIMTGVGFENVELSRAMSASGARYVDTNQQLELWNKGDRVTVKRGEETLFYGTTNEKEAVALNTLQYVQAVDWPPLSVHSNDSYTCTNTGSETSRTGISEEREIGSATYCVKVVSEGAAGSVYRQYAYVSADGKNGVTSVTFSFRFPQCTNYSEPERSACQAEEDAFNPDTFLPFVY